MKKAVKKNSKIKENKQELQEKEKTEIESAENEPLVIVEEYSDPDEDDKEYKKILKAEKKAVKRDKEKAGSVDEPEIPVPTKKKRKKHRILKLLLIIIFLWFTVHGIFTLYFGGMKVMTLSKDYTLADKTSSLFVTNILIIGTDSRNPEKEAGRSDCIMLLSVNRLSRKIEITSFLRDSYVSIPGHGENRINAAFSYGGAPLLVQTIEENFKISIDEYVIIDFYSCMDIIDAVGGVTVDVTVDEANYVNMYLCEINQLLGVEQGNGNLTQIGSLKLNGKQALAYSRIRYIGTDFGRTDRQREVIMALIDEAIGPKIFTFISNLKTVFPEIITTTTASQLGNYTMELPFWALYKVEQQRVPADGTWSNYVTDSGMDVLKIDFDANIKMLRSSIFDK